MSVHIALTYSLTARKAHDSESALMYLNRALQ